MKKLNLGCGMKHLDGFINIDVSEESKADLFLDLERDKLPFEDNTVDHILAKDFLEHITNLGFLMNECWRVLHPEGIFEIIVPNVLVNPSFAFSDPTHVRFFTSETFKYFTNRYHWFKIYRFKPWRLISQGTWKADKYGNSFIHVRMGKKT